MSRVYLLLRNNRQSGPHSLEELLKLSIKPLDLIWVEGRSFGWSYPSEISLLKPYLENIPEPPLKPSEENTKPQLTAQEIAHQAYLPAKETAPESTPARKIYVSMPAATKLPVESQPKHAETVSTDAAIMLEQKAEALRKKIQAYVPENKPDEKPTEIITTKYSSTPGERAIEYSSWILNQKKGKAVALKKKTIGIALATLLVLIIGYGISRFLSDSKEEIIVQQSAKEIALPDKTTYEPLIVTNETNTTPPGENYIDNATVSAPAIDIVKNTEAFEKPAAQNRKQVANKQIAKVIPVIKKQEKVIAGTGTGTDESKKTEVKDIPVKEPVMAIATPKKKKTLNEKVDAFFGKFSRKKSEVPSQQEEEPVTSNNNGTVERKATRRDDPPVAAVPAANTNLADFVEITSNKPAENWMLGVRGLKVTVHNSGTENVKTAEVELRYYTEQNEVLDKKIVQFNNIPAGKKITLPAPDHRLADHADFRLVAVK